MSAAGRRGRCSCRSSRLFTNAGALRYRERHLRIVGMGERVVRLLCPRTGERWVELPIGGTLVLYRETAP